MMVLDSSAVIAVFLGEPEAERFLAALENDPEPLVSAATVTELLIVLGARVGRDARGRLRTFLREFGVRIVPHDEELAWRAGEAHRRFGKGNHPAGLNLGDCFAYALARRLDAPLLYKGEDFARTDIACAA